MATKTTKPDRELQICVTPTFRASYASVWRPSQIKPTDKPKYGITMLIPKTSDISGLKKAILNATIAFYGADRSAWPEELNSPIKNGDAKKYEGKEGYKGCYVVKASASADKPPLIVNEDREEIIDQKEFYSGCYARAEVYAARYEFAGNEGITFYLNAVQKVKDGKVFSNRKDAKEIFDSINPGEFGGEDSVTEAEDVEEISF